MKQYIFLTNQYLPKPGATSMCVHNVATELAKRGESVATVCYSFDRNYHVQVIDDVKVFYIPTPVYLRDVKNNIPLFVLAIRALSILAKLVHINKYPLRSTTLVGRYVKTILPLIDDVNKTTIIASYTPLEGVVALKKIKEKYPDIRTVYYSTDTLSNEQGDAGFLTSEKREKKGFEWEHDFFSAFDKIIIMECHAPFYKTNRFEKFFSKMSFANFPMVIRPIETKMAEEKKDSRKKLFVYVGTLYKVLRNPVYSCTILKSLTTYIDMKVVFMGGGDCFDILRNYQRQTNNAIEYIGMQPHDVALKYLDNADVLLSIGNKESPMAPSKIYEYISTGKPIIHFYTWDKDPCIEPLKKYGNAILINENKDFDIHLLLNFLDTHDRKVFDEFVSNFESSTPSYTANLISNI